MVPDRKGRRRGDRGETIALRIPAGPKETRREASPNGKSRGEVPGEDGDPLLSIGPHPGGHLQGCHPARSSAAIYVPVPAVGLPAHHAHFRRLPRQVHHDHDHRSGCRLHSSHQQRQHQPPLQPGRQTRAQTRRSFPTDHHLRKSRSHGALPVSRLCGHLGHAER